MKDIDGLKNTLKEQVHDGLLMFILQVCCSMIKANQKKGPTLYVLFNLYFCQWSPELTSVFGAQEEDKFFVWDKKPFLVITLICRVFWHFKKALIFLGQDLISS